MRCKSMVTFLFVQEKTIKVVLNVVYDRIFVLSLHSQIQVILICMAYMNT